MNLHYVISLHLFVAILSFGELKSGLINFSNPSSTMPIEIDFSELKDDSTYNGFSIINTNVDFIFSFDTVLALFNMMELNVADAPYVGANENVDSLKLYYDSIIDVNDISIISDYVSIYEFPNDQLKTSSFKIITAENHYAYFLFLNVWMGGLDHYTYYWAYDSESVTSVNNNLKNMRSFISNNEHPNLIHNIKGQKTHLTGKWKIKY